MSSSAPMDLYREAVALLTAAGRGLYRGPAVSPDALDEAYLSVQDLDTAQLRIGGRAASGDSDGTGVGGLAGMARELLYSVAGGTIAGVLWDIASDWLGNREDVRGIEDATGKAADAIDSTVEETSTGIEKMMGELLEVVRMIAEMLENTDPEEDPGFFSDCVCQGAELIDSGAEMAREVCVERDRAIRDCYDRLIEHGRQVCARSAVEAPVDAENCESTTAPTSHATSAPAAGASAPEPEPAPAPGSVPAPPTTSTAATGAGEAPTAGATSTAAEKVPPATTPASTVTEVSSGEPQPKTGDSCASPRPDTEGRSCETESSTDSGKKTDSGPGECVSIAESENCIPHPDPGTESEENVDIGHLIIGAVGIGLLAAGAGAIWQFVEQAVAEALQVPESAPVPEPAGVPEPAPKPAPTAESDLAGVPEPAPKPIPTAESDLAGVPEPAPKPAPTAESDLAGVPEPAPKPIPTGEAQAVPASDKAPDPAPDKAPDPAPQPPPAPEHGTTDTPVRKAGNW
ncbi:hypothetical protein [Corynebacterium pacaense]|uniref:hypothetical protein n=1 Tax=Corynebacterium pacaense TaxID=1816684 RepID=UPI0009BAE41E|nr:hypothetical protein [Corynebacterium pacaense]